MLDLTRNNHPEKVNFLSETKNSPIEMSGSLSQVPVLVLGDVVTVVIIGTYPSAVNGPVGL